MNAADYEILSELFGRAIGLPPDQRDRFLRERCPSDEIRHRLRRMIDQDRGETDLRAATGVLCEALSEALAPDEGDIPKTIGPYTITRRLAVGGMGVVLLAQQSSPRRTVVLKLLRADIRDHTLVGHFDREASILARLRHPGIAHVYDAGVVQTATGPRPYVVMEHIDGIQIDAHARGHRLTTRQVAGLVVQACDAIDHAHSRGVIHRDLKPGNLLVTPDGHVKVLDFGIARIVSGESHEPATNRIGPPARTTPAGGSMTLPHLLGTLSYMAPEQLDADGEADTRADVYGIGVVLHELLTGRLPIDTHGLTLREAIHAVRTARIAPIGRLNPALRGDIECIVATALARDRNDRYASAAALGEDLRRSLADRPIAARPPSLAYVFSKAARRHRAAFLGMGAALATLAIGGPIVAFMAADLARERGERLDLTERTLEASRLYEQASDLIQRRAPAEQARRLLDLAISANPQFSLAYASRARITMPSWRAIAAGASTREALDAVADLVAAHATAGGQVPSVDSALGERARRWALKVPVADETGFPIALQTAGETLLWLAVAAPDRADHAAGRLADAAACFDLAAATMPPGPRGILAGGWAMLARFERPGASEAFTALARSESPEITESVNRALGILHSGDFRPLGEAANPFADAARSAQAWSRVLLTAPADVEVLLRLADACRSLRQYDEAMKALARARDLEPTEPSIRHSMGWIDREWGRHAEAAQHFGMAAALATPPRRYWLLAGESYATAGMTDQAIECLSIHLTAYPADAYALGRYIDLLVEGGSIEAAHAAVDRFAVSTEDPSLTAAFEHSLLIKADNPAVTVWEVVAEDLESAGVDAQVRLAEAFASVGWYDKASDELRCAADSGVHSPYTILRSIGVHLATGDADMARQTAATLLARADLSASTWGAIARALDDFTLCQEAIEAADRARRADPERRSYALLLSTLLIECRDVECKDPARAAQVIAPFASRPDAQVDELDRHAEALMIIGRYREGRASAERAARLGPDNPRRGLWIAIAAAVNAERGVAARHLAEVERLIEQAPSDDERAAIIASLEPWYSQARAVAAPARDEPPR